MNSPLILVSISIIIFCSCNSIGKSSPASAAALRIDLQKQEADRPTDYIHITGKQLKPNRVKTKSHFFRSDEYETRGYYLDCAIRNEATLAKFKDVVLKLSYYSATHSLLNTEYVTIYQYLEPHQSTTAHQLVDGNPNVAAFDIEVSGATAVYN